MVQVHTIHISPPLCNSSCAWASDYAQLQDLYACPYTGAITTRTATLNGFQESDRNTVVFTRESFSSLNSYGYSPHPLKEYIEWSYNLLTHPSSSGTPPTKPVILSITESSPPLLTEMLSEIQQLRERLQSFHSSRPKSEQGSLDPSTLVAVELNTSCPNIPDHPPPSYDPPALVPLLKVLASAFEADPTLTIGLKLPPYTYSAQFQAILDVIAKLSTPHRANPIAYLACTNTLGSSLLFSSQVVGSPSAQDPHSFALPTGFGGLAGETIHALSLGNVHTFSQLISKHPDPAVQRIKIIGIGGVTSPEAVKRMHAAGAHAVGCATFLGHQGVKAFELLLAS
ncbi:hypothetical protein EUX98_g4027 [Antrodiella citrinella]|uniref:Dihydroorotate oxidase n=1 Tax=Antrodiella citrinella TaxID=2447956 RepID=A0A4S4MV71_9APHY|nr:hypothetical protein EUX98_g4027 [Antrodiella citrinella]